MANNWLSADMIIGQGSSERIVHYKTDTANIVDFTEAVNNLINNALNNVTLAGNTTISKLHVTGTSALDGKVTLGNELALPNGCTVTTDSDNITITANTGSILKLGRTGGWSIINRKSGTTKSSLVSDADNGNLTFDKNITLSNNLTVSGNITSPLKLPYATITSNSTSTTISTTSGSSVVISNSATGYVDLKTKSNHTFRLTTDGKATIDGSELLTKNEFLEMEHPIGSVYITLTDTNPNTILGIGTWVKVGVGLKLGIVGTAKDKNNTSHTIAAGINNDGEWSHALTKAELAKHSHDATSSDAGAHKHDRGDMNITGKFGVDDRGTWAGVDGAFSIGTAEDCGAEGSDWGYIINFDASKSWEGETSKNGNHNHQFTIADTGSGAKHNNVEPAFGIYLWTRTE